MVASKLLQKARAHRHYMRYKLRNPSHLTSTGYRWKAAVDSDNQKTGYCSECGEIRNLPALKYISN